MRFRTGRPYLPISTTEIRSDRCRSKLDDFQLRHLQFESIVDGDLRATGLNVFVDVPQVDLVLQHEVPTRGRERGEGVGVGGGGWKGEKGERGVIGWKGEKGEGWEGEEGVMGYGMGGGG